MTIATLGGGEHKVLCLPGWFGGADGWGGFPDYLDGSQFSYAFLDYRGYGTRMAETGEYTSAEVATDAIAAADELGWDTFSLVGHSMGGKFAQRTYLSARGRVHKLVGVTPVPANAVPFDTQGFALFDGAAASLDNRRAIIDFTTGNRNSSVWLDQMVAYSRDHSTPEAFAGYWKAWQAEDFADTIGEASLPVLAVVGEFDPAITAEAITGTYLAQYPNATLAAITNAGHYPMFETPVQLATVVEAFLAG